MHTLQAHIISHQYIPAMIGRSTSISYRWPESYT